MPTRTQRFVKRPRLSAFNYIGRHAYHFIVVTRAREMLLAGDKAISIMNHLREAARATEFELLAFTVMPDHVHVLAAGTTDESNAVRFVQRMKQRTSYAHVQEAGTRLWQPSFYDHAIRRADDVAEVARYIIENPVRAGLVSADDDWPYQGGTLVATGDRRS